MSEYTSQPTYTIKPPAWTHGRCLEIGTKLRIVLDAAGWRVQEGLASGRVDHGHFDTEAAARAWCEAKYYEWVRQFLEECK